MNQVINKLKKQIIESLEEDNFTGAKNQLDKLVAITDVHEIIRPNQTALVLKLEGRE